MAGREYRQLPLSSEDPALLEVHSTKEERGFAAITGGGVGLGVWAAVELSLHLSIFPTLTLVTAALAGTAVVAKRLEKVRGQNVGLGKEISLFVRAVLNQT